MMLLQRLVPCSSRSATCALQFPTRIYSNSAPDLVVDPDVIPENVVSVSTKNLPRSRPQTLKLIVRGSRASEWNQIAPRGVMNAYLQVIFGFIFFI